jgi:hypothetical protein
MTKHASNLWQRPTAIGEAARIFSWRLDVTSSRWGHATKYLTFLSGGLLVGG